MQEEQSASTKTQTIFALGGTICTEGNLGDLEVIVTERLGHGRRILVS